MDWIEKLKALPAGSRYPLAFKQYIIFEHLETGASKRSLELKYGVKRANSIKRWMDQMADRGISLKKRSLIKQNKEIMGLKQNKPKSEEKQMDTGNLTAQQRIKMLERQLVEEQLRSEAYRRMIELTEEELNIQIRKKDNTK